MISPQNLAIGTAAVGEAGAEGLLFRRVLGWSIAMPLALCAQDRGFVRFAASWTC